MLTSALLSSLLLAQAPTPSTECIEIRNVRALAVKNGIDDAGLKLLESQYCGTKEAKTSGVPAPPESLADKSPVCVDALILEQLAAVDPARESPADVAALRQASCSTANNPPELRYNSGRLARSSTGVWSYPSGKLARAIGGPWLYPDGKIAGKPGGLWNYPNGNTARYSDGSWKPLSGPTTSLSKLVTECKEAGGCVGPASAPPGGEDLFAAWVARELWSAAKKK